MFVIKKIGAPYDGFYVAPSGSEKSYVKNLQDAQSWPTREKADGQRCIGNEVIVDVNDILRQ
jgi:hypothetical protein